MKRRIIGFAAVSLLLLCRPMPARAASGYIFEGKVAARDGRPVPGAEIRLLDEAGTIRDHVFSDLQGAYRFPVVLAVAGNGAPYRLELSHLRFRPVEVPDAVRGARIASPGPKDLAPGEPIALLASAAIVRRDFVLTLSPGTPMHPTLGPIDPNYSEYCYQQALLLLNRDKRQAVELLKVYAQTGFNPKQIGRSLQLIALHDKEK